MTIIKTESPESPQKSIVLRLDGFHVFMSFLDATGHLVSGYGEEETLELVYAPNTVPKIFKGRAIARVTRTIWDNFLVDGALNTLLAAKTFQVELPVPTSHVVESEEVSQLTQDGTVANDSKETQGEAAPNELHSFWSTRDHARHLSEELADASDLYDSVMVAITTGKNTSEILQNIDQGLEAEKTTIADDRTATLWLQ